MPGNSTEPPSTKAPVRAGRRSRAILPNTAFAAFLVAAITILAIAGLSYRSLQVRTATAMSVHHTNAVQLQLNLLLSELKDAETGQRGFLLTGLESCLEPYNLARTALLAELATLRRLTADNPDQQRYLDTLEPTVTQKLDELAQTIALKRAEKADAAIAIVRSGRGKA